MRIGFVGLGRMGANMVERLLLEGHKIVAYDINDEAKKAVKVKGAETTKSLEDLVEKLASPRIIWVMVPAGDPTESTINTLCNYLQNSAIVVDGGNSHYKDSMRSASLKRRKEMAFRR
ncbi:MAG: NAD(P)-binding domain-containing protein [Candidatus Omnitrophota bacterium]